MSSRKAVVGVLCALMSVVGSAVVATPPDASAVDRKVAPSVTVPRSIDPTGTTDVTARLNAFLSRQPAGAVVNFPPLAVYRIDGVLRLKDKSNFVLDGNGARLFTSTTGYRERAHLAVDGGQNIVIRELVIKGAHPNPGPDGDYVASLEAQHGIRILGSDGVIVRRTTIKNVYGDFVYLGRDERSRVATYRRPATNITIVGNTFRGSGRQGIALTNADQVLVKRNDISQIRRSIFDFEPNSSDGTVTNVRIARNVIGRARLNSFAAGGKGVVDNIMIRNNTFVNQPMNAMIKVKEAVSRSNWFFLNNVSDRGFGSILGGVIWAVGGVRNLQFIGNTQPMNWNRKMAGVQSDDLSCGIVAYDNTMRYATAQSRGGSEPCPS